MKINKKFYTPKEEKLLENELKIIEKFSENKCFEDIIKDEPNINNYLHLSDVKENLLSWYDFKENSNLLEIGGGFGELTSILVKKVKNVITIEESLEKSKILEKKFENIDNLEVIVGDFKDINIKEKFDYIVITDYLEKNDFSETIKKAKVLLKENGTILAAFDNKYGIKNWKGKNECSSLIDKTSKFTKKYIEKALNELNLKNYKFYYIYPEYKAPNLIYTDNYKITNEDLFSRNFEIRDKFEELLFEENKVLENILKDEDEIINLFVNSFLVEISNSISNDIKYVSFTNYRKVENQIQTIITSDKVIKKPIDEKSENHIKNMIKNEEYFPKSEKIVLLDRKKDEITVESDFINGKRLDEIIEKSDDVVGEFEKFKKLIANNCNLFQFEKIDKNEIGLERIKELDEEILKKFNFIEYGFIDMLPKNCFVVNEKCLFFDQEWMLKFIPLEFILFRSVLYTHLPEEKKSKIYEKLKIDKYIDVFYKIEEEFTDLVNDEVVFKLLIKPPFLYKDKINVLNSENEALKSQNAMLDLAVRERDNKLVIITNSLSWKITKPLRWVSEKIRNLLGRIRKGRK